MVRLAALLLLAAGAAAPPALEPDPPGFRRPAFRPGTPDDISRAVEAGTAERLEEARPLWRSIQFQEGVIARLRAARPVPKEKGSKFAPAITAEQIAGRLKEAEDELTAYQARFDRLCADVGFVPPHDRPPRPGAVGTLAAGDPAETAGVWTDGRPVTPDHPARFLGMTTVSTPSGVRPVPRFEPVRLGPWLDPGPPAVEFIGHRGASWDAPENTVAAIRLAWEQRADAAECDVSLSKDGRLVVLHDKTFKRTAGVDRAVTDLTAAEAGALDAGRWKGGQFAGEPVPTLAAVLAAVPPGKRLFVEVKCGPEAVPELDRVLRAGGLKPEQTPVICFSAEVVAAVKAARPDLKAYWLVSLAPRKGEEPPTAAALVAKAKAIKADGLDLSATPAVLTADFARQVKAAGLGLYVWTVNDPALARAMAAVGADGLTTDRPGWLRDRLAGDPTDLRVMSYNVRYGTAKDGDNHWDKRKEALADTVRAFDPDLLGTQETVGFQRDFLAAKLPGFGVFGVGRDDGREKGEMMAVYWRTARFDKTDGGHFWYSPTPDVAGSKGWDTSLPRLATWVKLTDKGASGGKPVLFVNTHFDPVGKVARVEAAKLLRERLGTLGRGCSVVLTGDFNSEEGSEPYRVLFGPRGADELPLADTYRLAHPKRVADEGTTTPFKTAASNGGRIDWIGASRDWAVVAAGIDRSGRDGRAASDHFPVTAVLRR